MSANPPDALTARTFRLEMLRAVPVGVLETAATTFAVLIAIKYFRADVDAKATIQAAARGGLLASLFVVPLFYRLKLRLPTLAGWIHFVAGVSFAVPAVFASSLTLFITGVGAGLFCFAVSIPLFTQIYRNNYPEEGRGRLFSITVVVRSAVAIVFGLAAGVYLEADMTRFPMVLVAFSLCSFASAVLTWKIPEAKAKADRAEMAAGAGGVFRAFRWVGRDSDFRLILISWMFMGVGNLLALSVYVEYFGNPIHGFDFDPSLIAQLTVVAPVAAKMLSTVAWGRLFDRMNFFLLRAVLNLFFASAILCIFLGNSLAWFSVGLVLHGVALGGSNVAWSLWVTKLAPEERVAEYMSVHAFLTGIRGVATAYLAFYLISNRMMSPAAFGILCVGLIFISILIILPRIRLGRATRRGSPLTDDIDL